jgi:hypothetical protein
MRVVARSVVLVLLLALATAAIAAAPHARPAPKCAPGHRQLLAADAQAQVYTQQRRVRVPALHSGDIYVRALTDAAACAYGQRRTYDLGTLFRCEQEDVGSLAVCTGVDREVVAGAMVAYEWSKPTTPVSQWFVIVRDLRTGRTVHREPTGAGKGESDGVGATTALVVKSNGSVAWIVNAEGEGGPEVHVVDTTGSRLVARGTDIDPTSLALAGSRLYWAQGGKPFSAPLN